jgi:adenosylhomocysteine nucleosidase
MGPQNARRALTAALDSLAPRCVLTCGYAGGLNPDLQRGDLIYDAAPDGNLARQLSQLGARPGTFHCADHIAVTAAQKQALREQTRADAVEMESEVIRALCRQRSVAAATIRVISDDARSDLPLDFNQLSKADGNISYGKLALAMARSPQVIPRLMRFQRELDACSRKLAGLLQDLLLALR